jgi:hypothetical protein
VFELGVAQAGGCAPGFNSIFPRPTEQQYRYASSRVAGILAGHPDEERQAAFGFHPDWRNKARERADWPGAVALLAVPVS